MCPELELEPDTEDKVVSVVIVLWPLLVDLKLRPDLPLWKDLVLPLRNKLLVPLRVLLSLFQININSQCPLSHLTFLWAALWVLLSLRVRLSEMLEAVCPEAEADLEPILSLRLLRISESLWVTVGCLTAWVWCLLSWTSLDMLYFLLCSHSNHFNP